MLELKNISKTFESDNEKILAVSDISVEIKEGEFFTLVGPSGCGKSTILRIIAGLIPPSNGKVSWGKPPVFGFVFQNFALFPYLTVEENVEFGLKMKGMPQIERKKIVSDLIFEVGLRGYEKQHPKELSGGMKQRVGIARSLAVSPNVLLLDEPFSSLDEFTAESLRQLLLGLWRKRGVTIIMITHLVREAIELSNRIMVLSPGPGKMLEIIENKLPWPRNMRSNDFFNLEDKILALVRHGVSSPLA